MEFSLTVDIQAPPQRVWAVMSDLERWPEWTDSVRSLQCLDEVPLAVGSRARVLQPRLLPAVWQITSVENRRGFTWVTRSPGVVVTANHRLEPIGRDTRVTLSVKFEGALGRPVAWLTRNLNHRYLALEAVGLKRRSEQSQV